LNVEPDPVAVKVTVAPKLTVAVAGETFGAEGDGATVTTSVPVIVAPFLTTETVPVVPLPAYPVIEVLETTVKVVTGVPPIETAVTPEKLAPVIVNDPELAHSVKGATEVITGVEFDHA
jgi:hypothetical protein